MNKQIELLQKELEEVKTENKQIMEQIELLQKELKEVKAENKRLKSQYVFKLSLNIADLICNIEESSKPETDICYARIWNNGNGGRCSNRRKPDCDYCLPHQKQSVGDGLTNGDIRVCGKNSIPNNKKLEKKLFSNEPLTYPEGFDLIKCGIVVVEQKS